MNVSHFYRKGFLPLLMVTASSFAWGQSYPDKPITLVIPYPAGAAVDRIGRSVALELTKKLGKSVVVENVGGASGTIGAKKVQRSAADGYTLLLGTVNDMLVAPVALKAGYAVKDFTPIAKISLNSTVLVAHPSFQANNMDELVALAKRDKEALIAGATGVAMMQTIGGSQVAELGGFKIEHVVYRGGAPLLADLIGGQIKVGTIALTSALPMIRDGKLKALGIISDQRDPTAPQIPTVNEGKFVKGADADLWTGLFAPANLPAPVVARLSTVMREILTDPVFRDSEFKAGSLVVAPSTSDAFNRLLQQEEVRLKPLLANLKPE